MKPARPIVRVLWLVVVLLSIIGAAIVARRALALARPATVGDAAALGTSFARHEVLTMLHIVPGLLFIVIGPFQFIANLRSRRPGIHRWMGRAFVGASLIVGATALFMSPQMAIGGPTETAATTVFAALFLFALVRAFVSIRRREVARHREWMIRAYAIGLAVATIRPIVGAFFATRALTHLSPREFFGVAFWIGFTAHLVVAEAWIRYTRNRARAPRLAVGPAVSSIRRAPV